MTRETIVVLRVLDDKNREWWQALGLPDPARWSLSDTFPGATFARVVLEETTRGTAADTILEDAERFATHDPGVDWPSDKHTDPVDAIMAALDRAREEMAVELDR